MNDASPVMLTRRQVCQRYNVGKDFIYDGIKAGTFPRPVKIGPQAVRWRVCDLREWERTREPTDNAKGVHDS